MIDSDGEDQPELVRRPSISSDGASVSSASTVSIPDNAGHSVIEFTDERYDDSEVETSLHLPRLSTDGGCVDTVGTVEADNPVEAIPASETVQAHDIEQLHDAPIAKSGMVASTPPAAISNPWADHEIEREMALSQETVRPPLIDFISTNNDDKEQSSRSQQESVSGVKGQTNSAAKAHDTLSNSLAKASPSSKSAVKPSSQTKASVQSLPVDKHFVESEPWLRTPVGFVRLLVAALMAGFVIGHVLLSGSHGFGANTLPLISGRKLVMTPHDQHELHINSTLEGLRLQPIDSVATVLKDQIITAIDGFHNTKGSPTAPTKPIIQVLGHSRAETHRIVLLFPPEKKCGYNGSPAKIDLQMSQHGSVVHHAKCTRKGSKPEHGCEFVGPGVVLTEMPSRPIHGFVDVQVDSLGTPPIVLTLDMGSKFFKVTTYQSWTSQIFYHTQQVVSQHRSALSARRRRLLGRSEVDVVGRVRHLYAEIQETAAQVGSRPSFIQIRHGIIPEFGAYLAHVGKSTRQRAYSLVDRFNEAYCQSRPSMVHLARTGQSAITVLEHRIFRLARITQGTAGNLAGKMSEAYRRGLPVVERGIMNSKRLAAKISSMGSTRKEAQKV